MFKKNIEIEKITAISKTNSLLSSPAASITGRIELNYGKYSSIIISPKNKMAFIEDLIKINPNINNQIK